MSPSNVRSAAILGLLIFLGLTALGYLLGRSVLEFKQLERSVTVKGLSEREVVADTVIWPIEFTLADNDLGNLYQQLEQQARRIEAFLVEHDLPATAISISPPSLVDKSAQQYGAGPRAEFRFVATQTVTVHTEQVDRVRAVMQSLSELGKQGIVFSGGRYESRPQYLFTQLNDLKPGMIEEATQNARQVAQKFAEDSQSRLGKIRKADQGQFSIRDRDSSNPQQKIVRVVSTIEYYLSD